MSLDRGSLSAARSVAFDLLMAIAGGRGNSDELLHTRSVNRLRPVDRNLVTTLVMGVLRWQLILDVLIAKFIARPDAKLALEVATALRLGAFQLQYLDRIPAHAALSESVELAKRNGHAHAAGMVNAILRKIAALPRPENRELTQASLLAHPTWMVERWQSYYGESASDAICMYNQQPPPFTVRIGDAAAEMQLQAEGVVLAPSRLLSHARTVLAGDVTKTAAFREGRIRVQDEGSQLIAELAGKGHFILDCCAAPGGKTAVLAGNNPDARIVAADISKTRLHTMERLLRNTPGVAGIEFRHADVTQLPDTSEWRGFDLILCDAPCSGTGTIAHNPEIRLRLSAEEVGRQQTRQIAILKAAAGRLAPGGRLLYSTCSLEPEENEQVVEHILQLDQRLQQANLRKSLTEMVEDGKLTASRAGEMMQSGFRGPALRTLPGVHGCDGFYGALLVRDPHLP